ncbi:MAG: ATP-binding protein [Oscillospiraceae bacterium]|nr:ATP-binding protein [Oscillospiraceae bacterium]
MDNFVEIVIIALLVLCGISIFFVTRTNEKAKLEKLRKEFSANVSHELKTPLTTIYGYTDMMLNDMVKEEDKPDFIRKIRNESARMLELVEDIIRLSKWDENAVQEESEEFDLYTLGSEVIDLLTQKANEKNVSLSIVGGVTAINANKRMIHEVLYNLIDNAIKYNKPNGSVRVSLSTQKNKTVIKITDTGIGIPQKYQNRVFERFFRIDKSRSKQTGGTGLGLSIVKHIVQHHKGDISIESKEDIGTKVTVRI